MSSSIVHRIVPTPVTATMSPPMLTKSASEFDIHLDAQLSTWIMTESESKRVPVAVPAVVSKHTVSAVLYHAEVRMLGLLKPIPLDAPFLTPFCFPFLRRWLVADDAIASPTALIVAEIFFPADLINLKKRDVLCFLLHFVAAREMMADALQVRDSLHIIHNNQPWTTSTPPNDHGAQTVKSSLANSDVKRALKIIRTRVGQNTAVPWPISYLSSSSAVMSPVSSWIAWSALESDRILLPVVCGLSFLTSLLSHLLG